MAESGQAWQLGMESIKERLRYLYTTGEYSDLDIVFPEHETTFKVHRTILSMTSPVFGTMMTGPLAPGKELPLPEDSPEVFRKLLDHMYMDRMDLKSVEEALEVYAVAHRYQMESSRKCCLQYILSNLNEKTTLAALEMSLVYEDEEMNKKCKEILGRNADSVISSENISHLSKETLRDLLKDDTMNFSSEVVPFKGLIAWGKAQLQHQKPSGSDLREIIGDLLKEIRFLTMSYDEFIKNVIDTNVLSHTECIHIMRVIGGTDPSTIPEDTPLNPSRVKRYPKFRRMEDLSLCKLDLLEVDRRYSFLSNTGLIENLSCNKTIEVYYFKVRCGGTISIMDNRGEVVGSSTSKDGVFTFTKPAVLQKDKQYEVVFSLGTLDDLFHGKHAVRNPIALHNPIQQIPHPFMYLNDCENHYPFSYSHHIKSTVNVGNLTFSFLRGYNCEFYFWESTSR
ncbi:BTB/POZ domain-containing protein 6-B-like isoform X2 [Oratosquilla oratoria]|uniref:BTB/POZ domain-containing protein 6-B-like isoform X2 n=1 Tax=Oratosquilla oratoria TaxID=337810 RepID=UPI003F764D8D